MLVVRGRLDNRQALVNIGVQRFTVTFDATTASHGVAEMPMAPYRALLDTGAQRTCLTHRAIANEHLARHGKKLIKNVHDENVHSLFMVKFGFWCSDSASSIEGAGSYWGLEHPVEVINIADNDRFDAIIGMDILSLFDVTFRRNGEFEITLTS